MADFGQSFASGVSQGAGMAAQGQQMRLQRRVAELQEERARIMEPLQMKALEQQNMLQALKIKQAELEQTYTVQIETAFTQASELLSKSDLTDPSIQTQLFGLFKKTPQALDDPRFEALMRTIESAQRLGILSKRASETGIASGPPNAYKVKDPVTGKDISVLQTGPNSFQIVNDQKSTLRAAGLKAKLQAITKQNPLLVPLEQQAKQIQQVLDEYGAEDEEESIRTYTPGQGWPPK